jgi:hypothetical protein
VCPKVAESVAVAPPVHLTNHIAQPALLMGTCKMEVEEQVRAGALGTQHFPAWYQTRAE